MADAPVKHGFFSSIGQGMTNSSKWMGVAGALTLLATVALPVGLAVGGYALAGGFGAAAVAGTAATATTAATAGSAAVAGGSIGAWLLGAVGLAVGAVGAVPTFLAGTAITAGSGVVGGFRGVGSARRESKAYDRAVANDERQVQREINQDMLAARTQLQSMGTEQVAMNAANIRDSQWQPVVNHLEEENKRLRSFVEAHRPAGPKTPDKVLEGIIAGKASPSGAAHSAAER